MAKSTLGVIVALSFLIFSATTSFASETRKPLSIPGEIGTPSILADRVAEVLTGNPDLHKIVRGTNASALQFIEAVRHLDASVDTYPKFDKYLRSLTEGPMPEGMLHLSEIDMVNGKPVLDLKKGTYRHARPGEKGWYDGNKFVLAGDCMNTDLPIQIDVLNGILGKERKFEPFAGTIQEVKKTSCELGIHGRYVAVHMFKANAAQDKCSVDHMLPQDGNLGEKKEGQVIASDHSFKDAFSRMCSAVLHSNKNYKLSEKKHAIRLSVVVGKGKDSVEHPFFEGYLTGDTFTADGPSERSISRDRKAVIVPEHFKEGAVTAIFPDQSKVRTPTKSGVGEDIRNFKYGCAVKILTAIEMP